MDHHMVAAGLFHCISTNKNVIKSLLTNSVVLSGWDCLEFLDKCFELGHIAQRIRNCTVGTASVKKFSWQPQGSAIYQLSCCAARTSLRVVHHR